MELRVIPNTDGRYSATPDGQIWSHYRKRFLKQSLNDKGYCVVHILCHDGKQRDRLVHRLVAKAYIPNPENKPTINHINEIKTDNRVENLEWATYLENNTHGTRLQRIAQTKHMGKCIIVKKISLDGEEICTYSSIVKAAKDVGCSEIGIRDCLKGIHKTCGGYKWEFVGYGTKGANPQITARNEKIRQEKIEKKKVYQFSLKGELIAEFSCVKEASKAVGTTVATIYYGLHHKLNMAYGYRWSKQKNIERLYGA